MPRFSLHRLEKEFAAAPSDTQRLFLMRLPQLLDLSPDDLAALKTTEPSFKFWNNPDDAVYDTL